MSLATQVSSATGISDPEGSLIPPHLASREQTWVDVGLALTGYPPSAVYARLLRETSLLIGSGQADLCLFVHKPPGLRWRLRVAANRPLAALRASATAAAGRILDPASILPAVYEPQQTLFGGPRSMEFVHQTWCTDSMLWMRWHARHDRPTVTTRWELSFGVLAHLFRNLGVVGWEDREVWNCLAEETGRRLAEREWSRPEVQGAARSLRVLWNAAWRAPGTLPRPVGEPIAGDLDYFAARANPMLSQWHATCLSLPTAQHALTPRRAAAYWTVFHWNRAGLSAGQQALAAQALAGRV